MAFRTVGLDALRVQGARALRRDPYYARLAGALRHDGYRFRVAEHRAISAGHALLLNLSFWSAGDVADVLVSRTIQADVVAHVAWHHVARRALGRKGITVDGMLLGESLASAFDMYLVGHLLRDDPDAELLRTQVPALSEVAADAGLSAAAFARLLSRLAHDPERAFAELRQLLFEVATTLVRARGIDDADAALQRWRNHPLSALLHHYNVSNWILHSRAYGPAIPARIDVGVAKVDAALRASGSELEWLAEHWLRP